MPTALFPSQPNAELIDVELVTLRHEPRRMRLLVDSGFTGASSLVLVGAPAEFIWASVPPAMASGALTGEQARAWVMCRVPQLGFEQPMVAILTEDSQLSLPPDVDGLAGLRFLRHFHGWGAEREGSDKWRFFLRSGEP